MATELPISELSGDLRSPAVGQHRIKKRRVKYRNVNLNLIGEETGWTDKNKYKMDREASRPANGVFCCCSGCQRDNKGRVSNKKRRASQKSFINEEICVARGCPDKCSRDDSSDNDSVYGVTYSFDHPTGPSAGTDALSYVITEAFRKFENKELATLLKNEYEIIDSNDSDSDDFELI